METSDIDIRPESSGTDLRDQLKAACDTTSAIERENDRLKAHLDQAQRQLQPWSKRLGTLKKMRRENTPCLILHTGLNTFNVIYLIECAVQTDATLLANNFQHCWMLHVASVCTPCCMLLDVVAFCCAKFETRQTFQPTTPNISFVS